MSPTLHLAFLAWCLLTSLFVHLAASYPQGAPSGACGTLEPQHGSITQVKTAGLGLSVMDRVNGTLQQATHYTPGKTYQVTLQAQNLNNDLFCKGFLIQARRVSTGQVLNHIGAGFTEPAPGSPANYQLSACYPASSAVTHTNNNEKRSVRVMWTAPPASAGNIQFRYTCVQHRAFYYANLEGPTISPVPSASTDEPLQQRTTQPPPETTTSAGFRSTLFSWVTVMLVSAVAAILV